MVKVGVVERVGGRREEFLAQVLLDSRKLELVFPERLKYNNNNQHLLVCISLKLVQFFKLIVFLMFSVFLLCGYYFID